MLKKKKLHQILKVLYLCFLSYGLGMRDTFKNQKKFTRDRNGDDKVPGF